MGADNSQELVLKISGDAASGKAASDALIKGLSEAGKAASDSGKLIAGMSDAGRQAAESMKASTTAVNAAGKEWQSFLSGFDLKATLADPAGAASGALEGLAGVMGPLVVGSTAVAGAVTAIGAALFSLAVNTASTGAKLNDLRDTLGGSTPMVSRLANTAAVAGTDVKELTDLVFKMQVQQENSPDKFEKGLKQLSLDADEFAKADWSGKLHMVSEASNAMADSGERNAGLVNLMGKAVRDQIPTILKLGEAEKMVGDVHIWTDEESAHAEHFEMQLNALKLQAGDLAERVGVELVPAFSALIDFFKQTAPAAKFLAESFLPILKVFERIPEGVRYVSAALSLITGSIDKLPIDPKKVDQMLADFEKKAPPALDGITHSALELEHAWTHETEANHQATEELKKATAEAKKAAEADYLGSYQSVGLGIFDTGNKLKVMNEIAERTNKVFDIQHTIIAGLTPRYSDLHDQITGIDHVTGNLTATVFDSGTATFSFANQAEYAAEQTKQLRKALEETHESADAFKTGIAGALGDFPATLARAFEGGGGLSGAFESLGAQMGGLFSKKFASSIQFGVSKDEQGNVTQSFLGSLGSNLLSGGISAAIGIGVSALTKWISSLGGPSKDELAARDTFAQQGFKTVDDFIAAMSKKGAELNINGEVMRKAVEKVLQATHVSADAEKSAISDLNKLLDDAAAKAKDVADGIKATAPDFDTLTEKAAGFGVTLDALGPKFQQASISKTAADYLKTFQDLKDAGADVGGVLSGMSDEFSKLVQDSIRFGTVLPEGMHDIIQNLIDAKKLTDDQGNAITDITQIKFDGTPTDKGLSGMQDDLEKATDLMTGSGGVTDAIGTVARALQEQIPDNPFAHWAVPDLSFPSPPAWGGGQAAGGLYHVTQPTLFMAGEKPGGEDVEFSGIGRRLSGRLGAGMVTMNVNVAGSVWSERDLGVVMHEQLSNILRGRQQLRTR